jgi:hypothetical protein
MMPNRNPKVFTHFWGRGFKSFRQAGKTTNATSSRERLVLVAHPVCRWYKAEAITWTHNAMCGHTLGLPFQSAYLGEGSTDVNGQQELFEQILWIIWMKIEHMF